MGIIGLLSRLLPHGYAKLRGTALAPGYLICIGGSEVFSTEGHEYYPRGVNKPR